MNRAMTSAAVVIGILIVHRSAAAQWFVLNWAVVNRLNAEANF